MKYVYILKAGEDHYKVGISTNVTKRLRSIQTSNGHRVFVVTTKLCTDAQRVERELHAKLKAMGSGGGTEWFVLEPEDVLRLCIMLHMQPEIDVYENVDLNTQLIRQNKRHKIIEKKLDQIINIAQKKKTFIPDASGEQLLAEPTLDYRQEKDREDERLLIDAIKVINDIGKASTSLLQRRLRIGYGRAARIIEQLEEKGIIGPADGSRARTVLPSSRPEQ